MKRRQVIQSLLSLPGFSALPAMAQQTTSGVTKPAPPAIDETPKLALSAAEAAAEGTPHFFSAEQMKTLRQLASVLVPAWDGKPGATEAGVPEFLDFLIGQSPADRQNLYRHGLDQLEAAARRQSGKSFASLSAPEADSVLAPLRQSWTYRGPADTLGQFLWAAKDDVLRATMSSREWAAANSQRRSSGLGTYWLPLD